MPILTMSANACGEDEERCHGADMNHVLGKPVQAQFPSATLQPWLNRDDR
jgi:CheY-like chemotaxis protein